MNYSFLLLFYIEVPKNQKIQVTPNLLMRDLPRSESSEKIIILDLQPQERTFHPDREIIKSRTKRRVIAITNA